MEIISFLKQLSEDFRISVTDKQLSLEASFQQEPVYVAIDKFYFSTAILNVLDNAVKYSKGEVNISLSTLTDKGFFILKIKDQGIGIPKAAQHYLFDKFYRVSQGNLQSNHRNLQCRCSGSVS